MNIVDSSDIMDDFIREEDGNFMDKTKVNESQMDNLVDNMRRSQDNISEQ